MSTAAQSTSRFGRALVYTVFWSITAFALVAIIGSVASSLYGRPPPATAGSGARQRAWCISSLASLRDELTAEVTHELTHAGRPAARQHWRTFKARWSSELDVAEQHCASGVAVHMDEAFAELRALAVAYHEGLERVLAAREQLDPALDETLRGLKGEAR